MKTIYRCNKCGKGVIRDSNKKWIKSMCDETGKDSRLIKIEFNNKLVTKLCNEFLPKGTDLSSFDSRGKLHLQIAFEQGATVMMNLFTSISEPDKEWVSCDDRLPDDTRSVIRWDERNNLDISWMVDYTTKQREWADGDDEITHWREIPNPPEVK